MLCCFSSYFCLNILSVRKNDFYQSHINALWLYSCYLCSGVLVVFSRTGLFKIQPCFCSLCFLAASRRPDHDDDMENPLRWLSIAPLAPKTPAHICVVISMHGHPLNPPKRLSRAVPGHAAPARSHVMLQNLHHKWYIFFYTWWILLFFFFSGASVLNVMFTLLPARRLCKNWWFSGFSCIYVSPVLPSDLETTMTVMKQLYTC